jgi:NADPH-dependent 2,4-dienoyl-CoA reductase/sulfur reductase-like enzyme/nitrite reductase/ring-hydroxylating ferredoxin subunit
MTEKPASDSAREVASRMPPGPPGGIPGGRAALPAGALPTTYLGPQGDEQRTPPAGSPAPIPPAPVVAREVLQAPGPDLRPPDLHPVARLRDLTDGAILRAKLGDADIVLVRQGDAVQAFGAACPHAGAPLDGGAVCNGRLICPWHKAEFRVSDGAVLEPPALDGLTRYATRIEGDDVLVDAAPLSASQAAPRATPGVIAIIGSGAAGTAAAAALRRRGFAGRVLLIGPEADAPYDRTALSKFVLSGDMKPTEVPPLREADWFARNDVERIATAVSGIDAPARQLHLADGTKIAYHAALLAMGAIARRPTMPGMTLRGVHTLRGVDDAACIVAAATPNAHVVIMGSSFIGLEAASALRKRGLQVTVVSPDRIPFEKQFGPRIGRMFLQLHTANGVVFHLDSGIEAIDGVHAVQAVRLKDGTVLPADFVLVGAGVEPATRGLAGIETGPDGAVAVDASFRVADGLYAAGDCAAFPLHGRLTRIEHWRLAQQHGCHAAAAMLGEPAAYDGVPFFWTYHYGLRFESLGHATACDSLHVDGDLDRHEFVALQVSDGVVVGAIACQRERATARLIDRMRQRLQVDAARDAIRSSAGATP